MASKHAKENTIYKAILRWHKNNGRHDLPWQGKRDAYAVWVSEIMLQQTQVKTVIPYYTRFMQQFPSILDLAKANIDDVLHLWTGLGYYARARNLHKAAQCIVENHNGVFPRDFTNVLALPGVGRSTAGAVLAFAFKQHHAILDANVKRVLARFYAIEGWPGNKTIENTLWDLAQRNTPRKNVDVYTQAIMDFGATFCTKTHPKCDTCCLKQECLAYQHKKVTALPTKKPAKTKPTKKTVFIIVQNKDKRVLLQQRPPSGVWGGLWCLPEADTLKQHYNIHGVQATQTQQLPSFRHTFSHYHLDITPIMATAVRDTNQVHENNTQMWYKIGDAKKLGLAAPIKKILQHL